MEQILGNISNLVLVLDDSQKIVFANSAFESFTGQESEDYLDESFAKVLHCSPPQKEQLISEINNCLKGVPQTSTNSKVFEETQDCQSGDPLNATNLHGAGFNPPSVISMNDFIFSYEVFSIQSSQGQPARIGIIFNDLTKEKDFLDRMTQAENTFNLKTMIAGISHEVSNPVHSILSFSEAIQQEKNPVKVRMYAEKVSENSQRLGNVISRFSQYIQSKGNGSNQKISVNERIESALRFVLLPFPENQIELETQFSSLPEITGDPEEIQQVFVNILNNSLQAMDFKGTLMISTQEVKDFLVIRIKDTGPGMPREVLRKVYNPFFTTKKQGEGTGLGLSITQRLVEKYKGKMDIQSEENKGTSVSIYLPKE